MVDDLKFAVDNLHVNPDAVKPGKLTKWAAHHLLAEVYLCQKDYENARKCARRVIDSGYFSLMKKRFGAEGKPGDFADLLCREQSEPHKRQSGEHLGNAV